MKTQLLTVKDIMADTLESVANCPCLHIITPFFGYTTDFIELRNIIESYETRTMTRFIVLKVTKGFGYSEFRPRNHLYWEDPPSVKIARVDYDGEPFCVLGKKVLECHHGKDRHIPDKRQRLIKQEETPGKRQRSPRVSKKCDCPAKIVIREVLKFPDTGLDGGSGAIIEDSMPDQAVSTLLDTQRDKILTKLRRDVLKGLRTGERRFYIQVPSACEHEGHILNISLSAIKSEFDIGPFWNKCFTDEEFLSVFKVSRYVSEIIFDGWHYKADAKIVPYPPVQYQMLAALYYFGHSDPISKVCHRFEMSLSALQMVLASFVEFLETKEEQFLTWPTAEEKIRTAEDFKSQCGLSGVFGAIDAALIKMKAPNGPDKDLYAYKCGRLGPKCALVLQFIVDSRLVIRNMHIDSPRMGSRLNIFQSSLAWVLLQGMSNSETHIVAPPVYPLAPSIMTPYTGNENSWQEDRFNKAHAYVHSFVSKTLVLLKTRFTRLQYLDQKLENNFKVIKACCILHNIAVLNETEDTLGDNVSLEAYIEDDDEWHIPTDEELAEFCLLGGEEKRHYLSTVLNL